MTKRRLILLVGFVALIGIVLGVLAMLPFSRGVTKTNYDRIENGMTTAEVQALFGQEGEIGLGLRVMDNQDVLLIAKGDFAWFADDGSVVFVTLVEDCVVAKCWSDSNETILNKLRRWFHVQ